MAPSTTEARELAAKAVREAEHLAHEAARLKAVAAEAVEDGVRATKRAITHGLHDLDDARDAAAYRIKQAPLMTVGLAFGVGILLGLIVGQATRQAAPER
ncbi:MAG: hypothetical protein Q8T13_13465 [Acidobacteriota bacterium]|nr:hypothetical protein [Acidobacteriota bacterium]